MGVQKGLFGNPVINVEANKSLTFNQKLFSLFKALTGNSPLDAPKERHFYPRLIRKVCADKFELLESAVTWAWNLRKPKVEGQKTPVEYYWRGKLTTLEQIYYKILPSFMRQRNEQKAKSRFAEMKREKLDFSIPLSHQENTKISEEIAAEIRRDKR